MKTNAIVAETRDILMQLIGVIDTLTLDEYTQKVDILSNSSIGEHTRHVIELFQQLEYGYHEGCVNYDKRKRNLRIQQEVDFATECMANIIRFINKPDKSITIRTAYNNEETSIESTYFRELLYNIEHVVHHQAIIKIGLMGIGKHDIDDSFGVAKSTLIFRQTCVQ